MYTLTSHDIRVSVLPQHLADSSSPGASVFAFAYNVTIENLGAGSVQLLERHWLVESAGKLVTEVVGPGVVGEQPVLEAGESFEYTSSTVIKDPVGSMYGSYTFRSDEGKYFEVSIPRFDLLYPLVIH